jgi:hypothetical protein
MENHSAKLLAIDVSEHVEQKGKFSYLSWPYAVARLIEACPDATWEVAEYNGLPFTGNQEFGYFVKVTVTANGVSRTQIHPILDHKNNTILSPSSFDINTSIQRGLVKAIALHGLGLNIYAGEDLPMDSKTEELRSLVRQINTAPIPKVAHELWMKAKAIINDSEGEATWWAGIQSTPRRQIKEYGEFLKNPPQEQSLADVLLGKEAA